MRRAFTRLGSPMLEVAAVERRRVRFGERRPKKPFLARDTRWPVPSCAYALRAQPHRCDDFPDDRIRICRVQRAGPHVRRAIDQPVWTLGDGDHGLGLVLLASPGLVDVRKTDLLIGAALAGCGRDLRDAENVRRRPRWAQGPIGQGEWATDPHSRWALPPPEAPAIGTGTKR